MMKLFLSSFLVVLLAVPTTICGTIIEDTCKAASESSPNIKYDFCVSSVQAAPNSGSASSTVDVGLIGIDLLKDKVTTAVSRVDELLGNSNLDPGVQDGLRSCADFYSDTVSTTDDAIEEYKAKDYQGANVKVSAIFSAASDCEDSFSNGSSPLGSENDNVIQLSALALYITNNV